MDKETYEPLKNKLRYITLKMIYPTTFKIDKKIFINLKQDLTSIQ